MRFIKRIFQVIGVIIGILFLIILGVFLIDGQKTSYLHIPKDVVESDQKILIKNVNLIPMTMDTVMNNKSVLVQKGIITQIEDDIDLDEVTIIDGTNQFLMPGLIDMHVHVWDEYELGLYLANGITTVRNLWGQPMHLRMKEAIEDDEIYSPLFFTSGPKLTGPEFIGDDNYQLFSAEEAREVVRSTKEKGYDFIKTYYGLPQEYFDIIMEEAELNDLDIVAHPSNLVDYRYHFKSPIVSIEHAEDIVQQPLNYTLDTLKLNEVVASFKEAENTSFCPTLTVYHNIHRMLLDDEILKSQDLNGVNPLIRKVDSQAQYDRWASEKNRNDSIVGKIEAQHNFHLSTLNKLNRVGVNIICGTDAGIGVTVPGSSIHQELQFYSEAGLSNFEVLETATINPTKTHDFMRNLGTIETGKTANLLLLKDNPLNDLSALKQPSIVFIKGRMLDESTLNKFQEEGTGRNNLIISLVRYIEFMLKKY
ncbi:amidohydrolase family protein [Mangrovimonas sp. AS39]|uniref:amidohydrolase family protein n=1 Tax=Mangrovimonas futianensis TaxID=2895523 RepID=UPI001E4B2D3B|nr:amidohydrolase family protein [Mangrovimonas futianensis]MCF1192202.1 amidohydrolase family protein [Mangrovimonas futianensis]MCF1196049.1 amidohydrolase family protein [Mangrovimonas futianensis]